MILISCSFNKNENKDEEKSKATLTTIANKAGLKSFKQYNIHDTINTDLNGDRSQEKAYFKITSTENTIVVLDGTTKEEIAIGLDQSFGKMGGNFYWADFWGITTDNETYENIIIGGELTGSKKVKLINPSIFVGKNHEGGGIITFKEGKFIWIHQAE